MKKKKQDTISLDAKMVTPSSETVTINRITSTIPNTYTFTNPKDVNISRSISATTFSNLYLKGDAEPITLEELSTVYAIYKSIKQELYCRGDFTLNIPRLVNILLEFQIVKPKD